MVSASLALRSLLWTILLPGVVADYVPWRFFGLDRVPLHVTAPLAIVGTACIVCGVRSQFGDSYDDYAEHVGRWIPTRPRTRA